jgi:thiamine-phosphate pyrophosphorylase
MERGGGLTLPWICLVTDRGACPGGLDALEDVVAAAVAGGVNAVQVRDKALPADRLWALAERLRAPTRAAGAALLVNDRADVALAVEADGVHLGEHGLPIPVARRLVGSRLVGRSTHDLAGAQSAQRDGADYVVLGTIFPSDSHPGQPTASPDLLPAVRSGLAIPTIAIGGITPDNASEVIAAGADGVAVIRSILADPRPEQAARRLVERVRAAWVQVAGAREAQRA